VDKLELSYIAGENVKQVQLLENSFAILREVKHSYYNLALPILVIYLREF
jgi:hypothetical protein